MWYFGGIIVKFHWNTGIYFKIVQLKYSYTSLSFSGIPLIFSDIPLISSGNTLILNWYTRGIPYSTGISYGIPVE